MDTKFPIRDIMNFLGIEEENIIKSVANFGDDFFLAHNLDILYRNCLELKEIDKPKLKIPAFLFLNSHREFYLGVASFLRLHKSKSFFSLRSALDSAFTAYYLLKYPNKIEVYLSTASGEPSEEWKDTFLNIKRTIKEDINNFPLAKDLIKVHEFCSIYSHSDALGIMHRYSIDKERLMLYADYFDYEDSIGDYKKWLGAFLDGFFGIFLVFWNEMFKLRAEDKLENIEQRIAKYRDELESFKKKYYFRE